MFGDSGQKSFELAFPFPLRRETQHPPVHARNGDPNLSYRRPGNGIGAQVALTISKQEAVPIARLQGDDRKQVIGWVYLWNTSELSILWIDRNQTPKHIDPPLCPETLARTKAVTTDAVIDLLEVLSTNGPSDPK